MEEEVQLEAILVMNGTEDQLVPYDGGQVRVLGQNRGAIVSTDKLVAFWREQNECAVQKPTIRLPDLQADGTTVSVKEYNNYSWSSETLHNRRVEV